MDEQSRVTNSMGNNWSSSISSNSFIGDISNISIISISIVSHMLDATIRKSNRVRSSYTTSSISTLSSIKTRTGVVIIDSIGVGVWAGLIRIDSSMSNYRVCKKRGMGYHWSMGKGKWVSYSMSNWMTNTMDSSGSMETVWRVSHSGDTSSESL